MPLLPDDHAEDEENDPDFDAQLEDDSDLSSAVIGAVVAGRTPATPVNFGSDGAVSANIAAESNDEPDEAKGAAVEVGDGKRKRKENSRYSEAALKWWKDA